MSITNTFSGFEAYLGIAGFVLFSTGFYFTNYFLYILILGGISCLIWMGIRLKRKSDNEDKANANLTNLINAKDRLDDVRQRYSLLAIYGIFLYVYMGLFYPYRI